MRTDREIDFRRIVHLHRRLLLFVLGGLLLMFGPVPLAIISSTTGVAVAVASPTLSFQDFFAVGFAAGYGLIVVGSLAYGLRLAFHTQQGHLRIAVYTFVILLPMANLVANLWLQSEAAVLLRGQRLRVGFLGVRKDELTKLNPMACWRCAYDLAGIQDSADNTHCPECGWAFERVTHVRPVPPPPRPKRSKKQRMATPTDPPADQSISAAP